jgi:hypothetical protein
MATDRQSLLESDGWRDVSEYVPSRDYCYVKGFAARARGPSVAIARRGKHDTSYWWQPDGIPLALGVIEWKPFPNDGISPHQRWLEFSAPSAGAFVRPPEPVYEPAGVDAKLTPGPRDLLLAMHGDTELLEYAWRWTEWKLRIGNGNNPEVVKISERAINRLRECAFINRDGVLPPGRLTRWYVFGWVVTAAGKAWIEANVGANDD